MFETFWEQIVSFFTGIWEAIVGFFQGLFPGTSEA